MRPSFLLVFLIGCEVPRGALPVADEGVDAGSDASFDAGGDVGAMDSGPRPDAGPCDGGGAPPDYYEDLDLDGYGAGAPTASCVLIPGRVTNGDDCNDDCPSCTPVGVEACDGLDNDCDGEVDEGLGATTYYRDQDGDGYGDPAMAMTACIPPSGWVSDDTDCDDDCVVCWDGFSTEFCDGRDNDCDGDVDSGCVDCFVADADGSTYLVCNEASWTWSGADSFCTNFGLERLAIESAAESAAIWAVLDPLDIDMWTGGFEGTEGTWEWSGGGVFATSCSTPPCVCPGYCNWQSAQPNSDGVTECLQLRAIWGGAWSDHGCNNLKGLVCEFP